MSIAEATHVGAQRRTASTGRTKRGRRGGSHSAKCSRAFLMAQATGCVRPPWAPPMLWDVCGWTQVWVDEGRSCCSAREHAGMAPTTRGARCHPPARTRCGSPSPPWRDGHQPAGQASSSRRPPTAATPRSADSRVQVVDQSAISSSPPSIRRRRARSPPSCADARRGGHPSAEAPPMPPATVWSTKSSVVLPTCLAPRRSGGLRCGEAAQDSMKFGQ